MCFLFPFVGLVLRSLLYFWVKICLTNSFQAELFCLLLCKLIGGDLSFQSACKICLIRSLTFLNSSLASSAASLLLGCSDLLY